MKLGAQFAEKSLLNIEHLHGASKKPLTVNYSRSNYVNKESRQVFLCLILYKVICPQTIL